MAAKGVKLLSTSPAGNETLSTKNHQKNEKERTRARARAREGRSFHPGG